SRNMATTITLPATLRTPAIGALTVTTKAIAETVARHGGSTFQTNIFSIANRVGGCGDPAGQHSRQLVDKIARSMPGHVTKQITAQITSYFDKRCARDPACGTPKQIVGSDKRTQQQEGYPDTLR